MFQYSFGRLLEIVYKKEVAYDTSFFSENKKFTNRNFLLDKFNTQMRIASDLEIKKIKYSYGFISVFFYFFNKVINKFIFKKYYISYNKELLDLIERKNNLYLEGYFQSHYYCAPIINALIKEFSLKENPSQVFNGIYQQINECESVSVHIRRGDYLNDKKDISSLDVKYYKDSINKVEEKIKDPIYFIFSDDTEWVKINLGNLFNKVVYVTNNKIKDYEEVVLMSKCKHNIIANSSFSWWGAMLNESKNKIVIYPKDWKNIFFKKINDLCPEGWCGV